MNMPSIKCKVCGRQFVSKSPDPKSVNRLKANLANHMKGSHPEHYKPKNKPKTSILRSEDGTLIVPSTHMACPHGANPPTRPYTRKAKPESSVNFCPKCGCNIRAVNVAVGL